jgi:hypothetical protein
MQLLFWQSAPVLQPWPFGHLLGHVLPQSTPVSVPFFTVSVQVGFLQMLEIQLADVQSVLLAQPWSFGHLGQVPPQSVPVSLPFLVPSVHDGVWHAPLMHAWPPVQLHVMLLVQLSLSCPHLPTRSAHVKGLQPHVPLVHGPLAQSVSPPQVLPGGHVAPQLPPQSTSVSAPFFTASLQVAG